MNKAFSLVEVLIVVAILGILAAIALPEFQSHTTKAKEVAAKDILRTLHQQIELYAARHDGAPPGYPNDDVALNPAFLIFVIQMFKTERYLSDLPQNPFNDLKTIRTLSNGEQFPAEATGQFGWVYKPLTKEGGEYSTDQVPSLKEASVQPWFRIAELFLPGYTLTLPVARTAEEMVPSGPKTNSQSYLFSFHVPTRNAGNWPSPSTITSTPV